MIKRLFFLTVLTILSVCCTNEMDGVRLLQQRAEAPAKTVFYATIADGAQTKVFADEQMRVLWNAADRISIFDKNTGNQQYQFEGEDGDNAGSFSYVSGETTATQLGHVYSLYPFNETTVISNDGILTAVLPAHQTYKENSFGIGANTMLSVSDGTKLMFRNVGGYLSFKFYGTGVSVKSITLSGNNHEKLGGNALITMPLNGTPTTVMQDDALETVTLTCTTPVALGTGEANYKEFWFVIPPTTFSQGFTVTVTDNLGGTFTKSTSSVVTVSRNNISRMSPIEVVTETVAEGLFINSSSVYTYDKTTDQVNIIEAEGKAWARFLSLPTLTMYEVGPIPVNVMPGDSFDATLSVFNEGIEFPSNLHFTVQSVQGGKLVLESDNGYRFVTRF